MIPGSAVVRVLAVAALFATASGEARSAPATPPIKSVYVPADASKSRPDALTYGYAALPANPAADGQADLWRLSVFRRPRIADGHVGEYIATLERYDCRGERMRVLGGGLYDAAHRLITALAGPGAWQSRADIDPDLWPLACQAPTAGLAGLPSLDAAIEDARRRAAASPGDISL